MRVLSFLGGVAAGLVLGLRFGYIPVVVREPAQLVVPWRDPAGSQFRTQEVLVKAARVVDGDMIELANGERVRYTGINAPETVHPRKPVQCFGMEAPARNRELVEGKLVRLGKDVSERDRYGRLLRYVWAGETFINLALVKEGYASVATYPPDAKYHAQFLQAQKEAQEAGKGLWGLCTH